MRRGTLTGLWLLVTALVGGAVVMAVELLGARMLSVGYGSSLAVWAAMISVTLLSLAVGYFVGGILSDLFPRPWFLHCILIAAGGLVAACPHFKSVVEQLYQNLGIRAGVLVSSLAIFSVPLCLLGMISPFVIRLLTRGRRVGVTAGGVYAISTLGSVAGTLGTGLFLIPALGPALGFRMTAVVAALTGAFGVITSVGWEGGVAFAIPFILAVLPGPRSLEVGDTYVADGERVTVLDARQSAYGRILVLEKGSGIGGQRLLVVNGIQQTGMSSRQRSGRTDRGDLLHHRYYQELLPYLVPDPRGRTALLIGLAGGTTAKMFAEHGIEVVAVDLDPEIIDVAREWFDFDDGDHAVVADGRQYLERCDRRFDFCVIDTYSGDAFPFHMASLEAFRAAKSVLAPDGVLAVNFIGSPTGRAFASIYKTLGRAFGHVLAVKNQGDNDVQTITLFGADRSIRQELEKKRWRDDLVSYSFNPLPGGTPGIDRISSAVERFTVVPDPGCGIVLTDDHNPIDSMRAAESVRWRRLSAQRIGEQALF
ncbi:MAG: fused MFS/spermidine synthase [Planctomycetota bacterium]